MHPDVLLHPGHFLKKALTGAAGEGGAWAWIGLIIGGIVGYLIAFSGDGLWTEGIIVLVAFAAVYWVYWAYFAALGEMTHDPFNGTGSRSKE